MAGWPLAGVGEGFCYYLRLGRKGAPGPWTPDLVVRCLVVFARFEIEEEERLFSGGGVEWGFELRVGQVGDLVVTPDHRRLGARESEWY